MATELRWLHLSDLHIGLTDGGINRRDSIQRFLSDAKSVADAIGPIDAVIFTGDLVQSGTAEQLEQLEKELLQPLWTELSLGTDVPLLAVPGNHDLVRPPETERPYATLLLSDPDRRAEVWQEGTAANKLVQRCFEKYHKWWDERWRSHPRKSSLVNGLLPGDYLFILEKDGLQFGFAGLNSAVLHLSDVQEHQLWVNAGQLEKAGNVSSWLDGNAFNVLLTHHPPSWLHRDCHDNEFINGLCAAKFNIHLFGHQHEPLQLSTGVDSRTRQTLQAASLLSREKWVRIMADGTRQDVIDRRVGYCFASVTVDARGTTFRVWPRIGVKAHDKTYRFAPDPTYELEERRPVSTHPILIAKPGPTVTRPRAPASTPEMKPNWAAWVSSWPVWSRVPRETDRNRWREYAAGIAGRWAEQWLALDRALPDDPWRDDLYAKRVLDRMEALRPKEITAESATLLCLAPFLHEVSWARELQQFAQAHTDQFDADASTSSPQHAALEQVQRAWPRVASRAWRLAGDSKRALGLWLVYRAAERSPRRWDLRDWRLRTLPDGYNETEFAELLGWLSRAAYGDTEWLFGETSSLWRSDRLGVNVSDLTAWVSLAAATALDVRRFDEALVDHVGLDEADTLVRLQAAVREAHWEISESTWDLQWACSYQIEHFLLSQAVEQANDTLGRLVRHGDERRPAHSVLLDSHRWPRRVTHHGVVPTKTSDGRPAFMARHVRFRLDHHRVRELLMGRALYGDPVLAVRELYQNALDACRYRRARQYYDDTPDYTPQIKLRQGKTLDGRDFIECEDNGIGMTMPILANVFSVAGRRFHDTPQYHEEWQQWQQRALTELRGRDEKEFGQHESPLRFTPNSQHGIGVLSYFMLADDIEIHTRAFPRHGAWSSSPGHRVRISSASGLFYIDNLEDDAFFDYGTRVRLFLARPTAAPELGKAPISLSEILSKLLWVAPFVTSVIEHCTTALRGTIELVQDRAPPDCLWEPGCPRTRSIRGQSLGPSGEIQIAPTIDPVVWWASETCPLLVDGIITDDLSPGGTLVNLSGSRYPELSADRRHVRKVTFQWLVPVLGASIPALTSADWLTAEWLSMFIGLSQDRARIAPQVPELIEPIFSAVIQDRQKVDLGSKLSWNQTKNQVQVSPAIASWLPESSYRNVEYDDIIDSIRAYVATLSAGPNDNLANPRQPQCKPTASMAALIRRQRFRQVPSALFRPTIQLQGIDIAKCAVQFGAAAGHVSDTLLWVESLGIRVAVEDRNKLDVSDLQVVDRLIIELDIWNEAPSPLTIRWMASHLNISVQQVAARLDDLCDRLSTRYQVRALAQEVLPEDLLKPDDWKLLSRDLDGNPPFRTHLRASHLIFAAMRLARPLADVTARINRLAAQLPWLHVPLPRDFDWKALQRILDELSPDETIFVIDALTPLPFEKADVESTETLDELLGFVNNTRDILSNNKMIGGHSYEDRVLLSRDLDGRPPLVERLNVLHALGACRKLRWPFSMVVDRLLEFASQISIPSDGFREAVQSVEALGPTAEDGELFRQAISRIEEERIGWIEALTTAHCLSVLHRTGAAGWRNVGRLRALAKAIGLPDRTVDVQRLIDKLAEVTPQRPYIQYSAAGALAAWLYDVSDDDDPDALFWSGRRWLWWLSDDQIRGLIPFA